MKKGTLFTMEAFIASSLVFMTVFLLFSDPVELPDLRKEAVGREIDGCFENASLYRYTSKMEDNITTFQTSLENCLPQYIEHETVVCDNGCEAFEGKDKDVISSSRFIIGSREPAQITVYGWYE
ncbi:MAG: hypothetical protein ACLFQ8_01610 [Candidatus Aenigmatarchaeota archaeon]